MLSALTIENIRNISQLKLNPQPGFNLICGDNGTGKTSILEAIYMLGFGRSFRHSTIDKVIQHQQEKLLVFANIQKAGKQIPVGLERDRHGRKTIKIDQQKTARFADLAKLNPIQLINPDSFQLINAGPSHRRQFLDWGVFHVEHMFVEHWKRLQTCLRQRNAALKQKQSYDQVCLWDDELVNLAQAIDIQRQNYIADLKEIFQATIRNLLAIEIELSYFRGWKQHQDLKTVLADSFFQDKMLGYTHHGPHKADIYMNIGNQSVQDVLSRGQQKLLVCALKMAQSLLLEKKSNSKAIYLVDDLSSELDTDNCGRVLRLLQELDSQIFLTTISEDAINKAMPDLKAEMFHVEHGALVL